MNEQERLKKPVLIFKCPCGKNKFKSAGAPNDNPTLKEKIENAEYIAMGCTVLTIPLSRFLKENWEWCSCSYKKKSNEKIQTPKKIKKKP